MGGGGGDGDGKVNFNCLVFLGSSVREHSNDGEGGI
jgi:hypothetical protein